MGCKTSLAGAALAGGRAGIAAASAGLVGASCLGVVVLGGFAIPHPLGRAACADRPRPTLRPGLPQRARSSGPPPLAGPTANRIGGQCARGQTTGFALGYCCPLSDVGGGGVGVAPSAIALSTFTRGGFYVAWLEPPSLYRTTNHQPNRPSPTQPQPTANGIPSSARGLIRRSAARCGAWGSHQPSRTVAAYANRLTRTAGGCSRTGSTAGRGRPGCNAPRSNG